MKKVKSLYAKNGEKHEIVKYPNGKYYNHYDVEVDSVGREWYQTAGGYATIRQAYKMLRKHRKSIV